MAARLPTVAGGWCGMWREHARVEFCAEDGTADRAAMGAWIMRRAAPRGGEIVPARQDAAHGDSVSCVIVPVRPASSHLLPGRIHRTLIADKPDSPIPIFCVNKLINKV